LEENYFGTSYFGGRFLSWVVIFAVGEIFLGWLKKKPPCKLCINVGVSGFARGYIFGLASLLKAVIFSFEDHLYLQLSV
jgi:hypothetical protein